MKKKSKANILRSINLRQPYISKGEVEPKTMFTIGKSKASDMICQDYSIFEWHFKKIYELIKEHKSEIPDKLASDILHHTHVMYEKACDRMMPHGEIPKPLDLNTEKAPWDA